MTFSYEVKTELCHLKIPSKIQALMELTAFAGLNAAVALNQEGLKLRFFSEHPEVARRITSLLNLLYGIRPEMIAQQGGGIQVNPLYLTELGGPAMDRFIEESGFSLMGDEREEPKNILARLSNPENAKAYLRGAFLAAGSLVDPDKSYHLEFLIARKNQVPLFAHVAEVQQLPFKRTLRKTDTLFYLKNSEAISDFLVDIGAPQAMLLLEDIKAKKEMKNIINRQANADTANYDKQMEASARQIRAIDQLAKKPGLDQLPPPLRDLAILRLQRPEASIKELGEALRPPLGKSGTNHRMKKLLQMAEEWRN